MILKDERITLYLSKEINDILDKLVKDSVVREKKNTIILRCLLSGLKTEYSIDFNARKE
jgi:hypothetical protein